jgi:pimeloyl-ACP methyl ester carboxylesterase
MRSRARRLVAALVCAAIASAGCSARSSTPDPAPPSPNPATASESPSATSPIPPDGRPIQPVPDVLPYGYADPPPGNGFNRYRKQQLSWTPCLNGLECATVLAPLDYTKPDGRALSLSLAKRKATGTPRLGTLFLNPGGPGVSGRQLVEGFDSKGLERYDLIGWDPRGTNDSTPVQCFSKGSDYDRYLSLDASPDDDAELEVQISADRGFGQVCLSKSGSLLQHISTAETVRDLDLLRDLVGDSKINYLGFSYGTMIGSLYAQTFPKRVGHLVLDGAVDIVDSPITQLDGFERALNNFADWCVTRKCALGASRDDILQAVSELLTGLDSQPIKVGQRQLTQSLALTGLIFPLYGQQDSWEVLRQGLEAVIKKGDGSILLRIADAYLGRSEGGTYEQHVAGFPAISCIDSQDSSVRKELAEHTAELSKKETTLGEFWGATLVCPLWPVAPAPKLPKITARGAAPIVVIGTTGDPATPYEYAVGMANQLDSGVLVTFRGYGHLAYGQSPCVRKVVQAYLNNNVVPRNKTMC